MQTLVDAMVARRELSTAWNLVLTDYDLVISPTLNVLPFPVGQPFPAGPDGAPNTAWANTALFNLTRHPAITTPAGLSAVRTAGRLADRRRPLPRRPGAEGLRGARGRPGPHLPGSAGVEAVIGNLTAL